MARSIDAALDAVAASSKPLLVVTLVLLAAQTSGLWFPGPDACSYLSIARTIASPGEPTNLGEARLYYPVGYPLAISPAFLLGDRPFVWISLMHLAWAGLFVWGVWRWARRNVSEVYALVVALSATNAVFWSVYRRTLSEMAFMAAMIWTAELMQAALGRHQRGAVRLVAWTLACAIGVAALVCLRQAGLTLAAGFCACAAWGAWRRDLSWLRAASQSAIVVLAVVVTIAALTRMDQTQAGEGAETNFGYAIDHQATFVGQVVEGVRLRASDLARLVVPGMFNTYARRGEWLDVNTLVSLAVACGLAWGWGMQAVRGPDVLVAVVPFYLGLYVIWPYDQGPRFMLPLAPVWVACAWRVASALTDAARGARAMTLAMGLHLAVAAGYWLAVDRPRAIEWRAWWPAVDQAAASMRDTGGVYAATGMPMEIRVMLSLALDRRVLELNEDEGAERADWLARLDEAGSSGDRRVLVERASLTSRVHAPPLR